MTCLICKKPMASLPMGEKNGYKLVACRACGSVMTDPLITKTEIDTFFGDVQPDVVHSANPTGDIAQAQKTIRKAFGSDTANRRFLDVACRQGYAVTAAKSLGYAAKGIDAYTFFATFAAAKYGDASFENISAADAAKRGDKADVIYAIDSFCEQPDLEGYVAALASLLAPGGLIYIQEPDGNSMHLPRDFTRFAFADPPINFIYPSKKGMAALLARHGLVIKKSFFTWSPFMKLVVEKKHGV